MSKRFQKFFILVFVTLFTTSMITATAYAKGSAPANSPPVIAQGEAVVLSMAENGTPVSLTLKATDINRDALSWSIYQSAANGTVNMGTPINKPGTSQITAIYKPNVNYYGSDSLVVVVKDSKGATDQITITINITAVITKSISYVALGDSIATGTIYPGASITTYVTYIYQYLQQQNPGASVTLRNLAADGARSNELYDKLGLNPLISADTNMISAISEADIITISIGGNNLMQAAKDSSSLGGYNFNKIDTAVAAKGVMDFNTQWPAIITTIKQLNPNAEIIVNTVYNPYNEADAFHAIVDAYLFGTTVPGAYGINDVIIGNSGIGYHIADVYTAFDQYKTNMGAITYFYPGPLDIWGQLTRNPHPNAAGQNIITNRIKVLLV